MNYAIKLLLLAAGLAPLATNQTPAPRPTFEVASIKPNHSAGRQAGIQMAPGGRFVATNVPLRFLVEQAYGVKSFQISGAPGWLDSERYDIEAKTEASGEDPGHDEPWKLTEEQRKLREEEFKQRVQALLAERCKLTVHHDTRELPIYTLVVGKNGAKLQESKDGVGPSPDEFKPDGPKGEGPKMGRMNGPMMRMGRGEIIAQRMSMTMLANSLSRQLDRNVVDNTGMKGHYDFDLKWTPDEMQDAMFKGLGGGGDAKPASDSAPDASGPSIFTAIDQQLGLKLESKKAPVEILVIDHIERPSEN